MTDIFKCERCGNVDSIHATHQVGPGYECHRCIHGHWHNRFEEERYSFDRHGPALNEVNPPSDDGWPSFS